MSSWSRTQKPPTNVYVRSSVDSKSAEHKLALPLPRNLPHIHYDVPTRSDIAVLMVFFNPAQSFRIIQNLLYIKHLLDAAHIPYFIGELAYNDTPHALSPADNIFLMRGRSYMFAKENIVNVMLQKESVAAYSKYVLLDCDVVFDNPAWVDLTSTLLDSYNVLQVFTYVNQLSIKFKSEAVKSSIIMDAMNGHTGYAWAFRRDWLLSAGGIYEYALIGGGDKCLAHMAGVKLAWLPKPYEADVPSPLCEGSASVSCVPGTIWHLPHGILEKRKYIERAGVLAGAMKTLRIEKLRDAVERNADGIFEWRAPYKPTMNTLMLNYFKSREDDG